MKKLSFVVAVALLAVGLRAEIIEQVLVKVNGEIITKTELERLQIGAFRDMPDAPDPAKMTDVELAKTLAQITPQVIVSVIDEMLLVQRAKELGFAIKDEQFNEVIASIKKDNKVESDEQFQAALKSEGLTLAQLKQMLTKRMLISQVQRAEVGGKVEVTEAEQKAYYDAHLSEFGTTPSVTLREIMVTAASDPKGISVGAMDEARKKAEAIRARVAKGEAFEKVAAEVSDAASKANGGLIGPISRSEMNDALLKMITAMKVGDITPIVSVPTGYAIFRLESSIESTTLPFEAAREQITDKIGGERVGAEFRKYLQKLRSQALIEWKDDGLRKAWEAGISAEPTL